MNDRKALELLKRYIHAVSNPHQVPYCEAMAMGGKLYRWAEESLKAKAASGDAPAAHAASGSSTKRSATTKE
jgi:hypothetical protein